MCWEETDVNKHRNQYAAQTTPIDHESSLDPGRQPTMWDNVPENMLQQIPCIVYTIVMSSDFIVIHYLSFDNLYNLISLN